MEILLIAFIFCLNLGISWWNSYAVGSSWTEAKSAGGWPRFMSWMGAIMSASGFTWCYLMVLAFGAYSLHFLPLQGLKYALDIGYLMIIPGVLFSGFCIMLDSWGRAYREGGVINYGVAAYNTYAQIHNTASAISGVGEALGDLFKGAANASDSDDIRVTLGIWAFIIACISAAAGIITTVCLIKKYSGSKPLLSYSDLQAKASAKAEAAKIAQRNSTER